MFWKKSPRADPVVPDPAEERAALVASLAERMAGPQRHRLLHGYPMVLDPSERGWTPTPRGDRPLLIGILPHPYCNPTVRGCGFCTFPHEPMRRSQMRTLALAVAREIGRRAPDLQTRAVTGVYFGGGTANLTPPADFALIAGALVAGFDVSGAEITLEGAPAYFPIHGGALLEICRDLGSRTVRISMGVQTFDPTWVARMGRTGLGAPHHVEAAVALARDLGVATSGDLLVALPGQPVAAMIADVDGAADLGFDQICIYPLVLRADLPIPWARDRVLMAALPGPESGFAAWCQVRDRLLQRGYVQRTLTNFERADLPEARRFAYEPASFRPTGHDGVGFGPGAISTFGLGGPGRAAKWQNAVGVDAYLAGPESGAFRYLPREDALAVLTRRLALREAERPAPRGTWPDAEIEVLEDAGLVTTTPERIILTDRGTFFADSVTGLLAERFVFDRRYDAVPGAMG